MVVVPGSVRTLRRCLALGLGVVVLVACAPTRSRIHARQLPERPDAPGELAQFQFDKRVAVGAASISPDAYRLAAERSAKMRRYSTRTGAFVEPSTQAKSSAAPRWESLGPNNVAGRTRVLEFDPRNPDHLFAAGVSGGVWFSADGGANWEPRSDNAANINIGSLAIDPVTPDVIYAGTGELYRNNDQPVAAMWGQGILRSTDGGRTFQQLTATANDNFRYVADLAISPHDHARLYAATNSGVWRSDNGGATFSQVLRPADGQGNLQYEGCNDLMIPDGHPTDYVLAACASRSTDDRYYLPGTVLPAACSGPCPAAVFLNTDAAGAGAWQQVLGESGMGRTQMDFARSRPDTIYAVSASIEPGFDRNGDRRGDYDNGLYAVWRSTDGGHTWQARLRNNALDALSTYLLSYADGFEAQRCGFGGTFIYGAGWYNNAIAVDPLDPEVVWVAGMEHYRSDNGGASFGKASYWFLNGPSYIHPDQHQLKFHPLYGSDGNRKLYTTSDGGVGVTDDATAPTSHGIQAACAPEGGTVTWRALTHNMATLQFYTGATSPNGSVYLGGAQDNGTQLNRAGAASDSWFHIYGGDGGQVAIDPRNFNVIYASAQNVSLQRSLNGGGSFQSATSGLNDVTIFIMPYVLDPNAPDRLYAGGTRIWRSDDQARTWRQVSTSFGTDYTRRITALAVAPNDPQRMLAGNHEAIYSNRAATASTATTAWQAVSPRTGWVSSLGFDPVDSNIAYATYSSFGGDHVWRSADAGVTWNPIDGVGDGRLPDLPVHSLAVDPGNRERLYLGTDLGVFVTIDGGQHWAVENTGFANVITETLAVARGDATTPPQLFAFTYGRGAWRVPLADFDGVAGYQIGADLSGTFYDPAQDGHGWVIDTTVVDGVTTVLAAWYTYLNGEQRWLIGTGPVNGNEARVALSITRGGGFPPAFDPASVQLAPWGEVVLRFDDRDHGSATWTTTAAGFSNGSMQLTRLTQPASAVAGEATSGAIAACHAGTWFNPQQNGHGLMVELLGVAPSRQMLAIWYTYSSNGGQRWLIGTGPVAGDSATLSMLGTHGGQFPPAFDPAAVVRDPWGTLTFRAVDADHAHIDWTSSAAGFNSGGLDLTRLSSQLGRDCL